MAKPKLPTSVPEIVELLKRFNEWATKLDEYSFRRQATAPGNGWTIQLLPDLNAERRGATEEATSAVLNLLRLLVQPRDRISFEQIVQLHELLPTSEEKKRLSRGSLSTLQEYLSSDCSVKFRDWPISRKELFEVYMYGKQVHLIPDKVAKAKRLEDSEHAVTFQSDFEDIVLTFIDYAQWYKALNEKIIQSLAASGGG